MKFEYQAIDEDGAVVRGIVKASSPEKVLQILLHKQLHPLDIRPLTDSTVELSRLNNLKKKLQGPKMEEPTPPRPIERKPDPTPTDWTYPLFIVLLLIVMVLAALYG